MCRKKEHFSDAQGYRPRCESLENRVMLAATPWWMTPSGSTVSCGLVATPSSIISAETIIDNSDSARVRVVGNWASTSASAASSGLASRGPSVIGANFLTDKNALKGSKSVTYIPDLPAGNYNIYIRWNASDKNASNTPVDVNYDGGSKTIFVNQKLNGGTWVRIGTFPIAAKAGNTVVIRNEATNGTVIADAVRFVRTDHVATVAPDAPGSLVAAAISPSAIKLTWKDWADTETGFEIDRSFDNVHWTTIATTLPNVVTWQDTHLTASTRYYYRVRSVNNYGESNSSAAAFATTWAKVTTPAPKPKPTPTPTPAPKPQTDPTPEVTDAVLPLKLSGNGRYFVKSDGSPFFYTADTAWALINRLSNADTDFYLADRAAKDFNVIQTVILNEAHSSNVYNQAALKNSNPATPNDAYFKHLDYVLNKAQSLGLYVSLLPTWGDLVSDPDIRIFNTANAYSYGKFLGARYRNQTNLIWVLGGDNDAPDRASQEIWRAMAKGIQDGDGGAHLMSYHPPYSQSSSTRFANDAWLDFNMIQSGHGRNSASYDLLSAVYSKTPVRPVLDAEPNYENIPDGLREGGDILDDYDVRKKSWWSVFAGGAGIAYGHNDVYQFFDPKYDTNTGADVYWKTALNFAGAREMQYIRRLVESHPYLSRVPDQSLLTTPAGSGNNHLQATRASDGSYAFVYSSNGRAFAVDLTKLSGQTVRAYWYDPRTGKVTTIGTMSSDGNKTFTPPTHGADNDWVLVLDDTSKNYKAPAA